MITENMIRVRRRLVGDVSSEQKVLPAVRSVLTYHVLLLNDRNS